MKQFQFKTNINCGGCVTKVTPSMNANPHITEWNVDTLNPLKVLTVKTGGLAEDDIKRIIIKAGFKAESLV